MPTLKGKAFSFLTIAMLICGPVMHAQNGVSLEYKLKAVFLFNFTRFVEWPPAVFASDQSPFVIGVLGENPFGSSLDDVGSGENVNGHPLIVRYYKNPEEVNACQILFISKTSFPRMEDVLASLKGKNMLTVSDAGDFLQQGGIVRFFLMNNKVQLQINQEAAKTAQLQISSKLLRLTEKYTPK